MIRRLILLAGVVITAAHAEGGSGVKQPIYIHLFHVQDDFYNTDWAWERLERTMSLLEEIRQDRPEAAAKMLLEVNGGTADMLDRFNKANSQADQIREGVRRGYLEVGYDGRHEPTPRTRPQPSFRNARTQEERWLARLAAFEALLADYKSLAPPFVDTDSARSGGLARTQEVFGNVASVRGVTEELGGAPELAHTVNKFSPDAVLRGVPSSSTWPLKNLDGVRDAVSGFSAHYTPTPDCLAEVYWQNDHLYLSDNAGTPNGPLSAIDGPEALQKVISQLDRTRPHVIRLELSSQLAYVKPGVEGGEAPVPILELYEYWKRAKIRPENLRSSDETDSAYQAQRETLRWITDELFRSNRGSRFLGVGEMRTLAAQSVFDSVSIDQLRRAAASYLRAAGELRTYVPGYAEVDGHYLSMADLFQLLNAALAEYATHGRLPDKLPMRHVFGPISIPMTGGESDAEVTVAELIGKAAELEPALNDDEWRPVPRNVVPGVIAIGEVQINAAQWLLLMAEALQDLERRDSLRLRIAYMTSEDALSYPVSRHPDEVGAVWTIRPAPLALGR